MFTYTASPQLQAIKEVRTFARRTYWRLAGGLLLASASAWFIESRIETTARLVGDPGIQWAIILAACAAALTFEGWARLPGFPSGVLLAGWSGLCGVASALIAQRWGVALSGAFLAAAGAFAAAAFYARLFGRDPLGVGGAGLFALSGITLATFVGWAPGGPYDGLAAFSIVLAFFVLAAWDAERVRRAAGSLEKGPGPSGAALSLWLDLVNRPLTRVFRMEFTGLRPRSHGKPVRFTSAWNFVRRSYVRIPAPSNPRSRRPVRRVANGV